MEIKEDFDTLLEPFLKNEPEAPPVSESYSYDDPKR
jgi:hypothetical protein